MTYIIFECKKKKKLTKKNWKKKLNNCLKRVKILEKNKWKRKECKETPYRFSLAKHIVDRWP